MGDASHATSYPPIGAHALIGDGRSAALVADDGSLDWLCWPRFDSPSLFGSLLDADHGGRFQIRPVGAFRSRRRYLPDTNVLETIFSAPSGELVLRDLMAVASEEDRRHALMAEHEILREVACLSGEVELEITYEPRPDYGRETARLEQRGRLGIWCRCGRGALVLLSDVPLHVAGTAGPPATASNFVPASDGRSR
jgi:GH15 family glucan-1,4-alpha-glucosidase